MVASPLEDVFVVEIRASVEKEPTAFFKVLDDQKFHYREGSSILPLKNIAEVITFRDRDERRETERKMGIYSSEPSRHFDSSSTTTNLPFDKFGSKRVGRAKIQNAEIDAMRAYVQGDGCRFLSDTTHEIRLEDSVDATSDSALANVLNAFLNSGLGGRIFYGFAPEGPQRAYIVRGMLLPRDKRDQFRLGVDDVINRFRPRPHHARMAVTYVPVLTRDRRTVPDLFMIEVTVEAQSSTVYFTADFRIYSRHGPDNVQVHVQQIRDMVMRERMGAWQAELKSKNEKLAGPRPVVDGCDVDDLLCLDINDGENSAEPALLSHSVEADEDEGGTATSVVKDDFQEAVTDTPISDSKIIDPSLLLREIEKLKRENDLMRRESEEMRDENRRLVGLLKCNDGDES